MKTKTHPPRRCAVAALTLSAFLTSAPAYAINAIINDNFTGGTDPWSLKLGSGYQAELDARYGWGRVRFTNGGTSRAHVNLDQPLGRPLIANVEYTIEFDAKADAPKSIDILIRNNAGILHGTYNYGVGTSATRKTIHFLYQGPDVYDARLSFRVGGDNTTVQFDNVVVTRKGEQSSLITKTGPIPTQWNPWQFPTVHVPINGTSDTKCFSVDAYDFSYAGYHYGEREAFINIPTAPNRTYTISAISGEDITDKINAALAAIATASTPTTANPNPTVGGTVLIPPGNFLIGQNKVGKAILIATDNTVIKGSGMGVTKLTVHSSYRSTSELGERLTQSFGNGVITFQRDDTKSWYSGGTASNVATVPVGSDPIPLNSFTITVTDPAGTLANYAGPIVIRQIMSKKFNRDHAWLPNNDKPWRWTDYLKVGKIYPIDPATGKCTPLFSSGSYSLAYYRKVLDQTVSGTTRTLHLDVPLPHELTPPDAVDADGDPAIDPSPEFQPITVTKKETPLLTNCGMQDLTFDAQDEDDFDAEQAGGATVMVSGLYNGLFKNIDIERFRSIGFGTSYPVNTSFINCTASNAMNRGGGGAGYGFYIRGQNLLYKNCNAIDVRHGFTTASAQTSNLVIKNCTADSYSVNSDINSGEAVDDTHLQYAHGILWDNHYSNDAGLIMTNRSEQSNQAWETSGWGIVWNYENEGNNNRLYRPNHGGWKDLKRNLLAITPLQFGLVIGAHSGPGRGVISNLKSATAIGLRVSDGYTRINDDNFDPDTDWGVAITTPAAQVGAISQRVMFEYTGVPVAESIYDIQFAQRAKFLNAP